MIGKPNRRECHERHRLIDIQKYKKHIANKPDSTATLSGQAFNIFRCENYRNIRINIGI